MSGTLGPVFVLGGLRMGAGRAPAIRLEVGPGGPSPDLPPARLRPEDWALADAGTGGTLRVEVLTAPDPRGAPLLGYDAQLDDGAWTALDGLLGAPVEIADLPDGATVALRLRARNAVGPALASAPRHATPTGGAGAGGDAWRLEGRAGALAILAAPEPAAPIVRGGDSNLQITG